ncbi:MAG: hypothetical protein K0U74_17585 [Alphaproteobacteria bacterium]|nr:hypothetical protein [Alphaproteobacteria bacterium]
MRPHSALENQTPEEFHADHLALAVTTGERQDNSPGLCL